MTAKLTALVKFLTLKRVRIVTSEMDLYAFKINRMVKPGYIFGVEEAYLANTRARTPMYKLCTGEGKEIPWRCKVQRHWCEPVGLLEYLSLRLRGRRN